MKKLLARRPPRHYQHHPWEKWFSARSKRFTLHRGRHYQGPSHLFGQQIRNKATKMGLRVSLKITEGYQGEETITVVIR